MQALGGVSWMGGRALDTGRRLFRRLTERLRERRPIPEDTGDRDSNIAWNRHRWGSARGWVVSDSYGTRWGGGKLQPNSEAALIADAFLLPHIGEQRDLKILELAPGAGRFTVELLRLSREMHLLDLNPACIEICQERFKYYPAVKFYVNDGWSTAMVPGNDFDLIACYDSMVHMAPDVIEHYVAEFSEKLAPGGVLWLDHAGRGAKEAGHRTDMTAETMVEMAARQGLEVEAQHFRNAGDCISVLRAPR